MQLALTLTGCDPYDGRYTLDLTSGFTTGELHIIKEVSGVRAGEIQDAFATGDTDLPVALSVIALVRAGKAMRQQAKQIADKLWDSPAGSLQFEVEGDAGPPAEAPTSGAVSESSRSDSGSDLSTGTENQD